MLTPDPTEVAWDGRGRWCGDGPAPSTARLPLDVPHQCSRPRRLPECGVFVCFRCKRCVPWCFGCAGETPLEDAICDDCWCELRGMEGDR